MEGSAAATAGIDDTRAVAVAACLGKLKCLPGSFMDHGPALRGLAAIGRGETPALGDAPSAMSLVELEAALRDAGSALLEQAGLLAGQRERGGVCAALQYLSFRCFCAVDVLHQAASGVSADAVPEGDALWGAIVGAWGSVRAGVNVEGALADLTRWWQGFEGADMDVAGEGGPLTHDAGGGAATDAALAGMRQQAEWLRGEAAGELRSESAAVHLECAASAVEELRGLLGCAPVMSSRKVKVVGGLDLSGGLECLNGKDVSVYSGKSRIEDEDVGGAGDVEQWAGSVDAGATALAASVGAVKRVEAARIAHGLPRIAQSPRKTALNHICGGGRADEPVGVRSSVMVQVQCEAGWPLRVFLEDEAWSDVGMEVKQRVAVSVLGVCAVAEACGVDLRGMGVGSFVVVGVGSGSVGDLVGALDGGGCEVVLSACGSVWSTASTDGGSGDGSGVLSVLREVLGVGSGALGGASGVGSSFVGSGEGGEHSLTSALEVLERGGSGCCMGAYAMAREGSGGGVGRLEGVESVVRSVLDREQVAESASAGQSESATEQVTFSEENTAEFVAACAEGKLVRVRELLSLTGDEAVDVHVEGSVVVRSRVCGQGPEAAFRWACTNGHLDIVRELLGLTGARAVDVHAATIGGFFSTRLYPEAAFRMACFRGHLDIVRELLSLTGARAVDVHAADWGGPEAALREACRNGHTDIVRELLGLTGARAVDVHAADKGGREAAFREACANGHTDIVRELLGLTGAREVDVHAADGHGPEAAFRWACRSGHIDIVRELLALTGARAVDVHAADGNGPEAAFRGACANGQTDIVRELLGLTGHRRIPDSVRQRAAKFESLKDLI